MSIFNRKDRLLAFLLLGLLVASCSVNGTFENREVDKKAGEQVTSDFYNFMKEGDYKESCSLFTANFFNITDTSKLMSFYGQVEGTCGRVNSYVLQEWNTKVIKGTNSSAEYVFLYAVSRQKCNTKETISLKKVNDKIQIMSYDVKIN